MSPSPITQPLPENVSITPITPTHLPAYRRLISLLLPIRYTDQFYKDSVAIQDPSSLALCAIWHEPNQDNHTPSTDSTAKSSGSHAIATVGPIETVVAGIQCRLEPLPFPINPSRPEQRLYIQTLATLAPYRSLGIAGALLDAVIIAASSSCEDVKEIYAHVWEANTEALEWYEKKGFMIEEGVVVGYYRKLRPSGARIVRRRVGNGIIWG